HGNSLLEDLVLESDLSQRIESPSGNSQVDRASGADGLFAHIRTALVQIDTKAAARQEYRQQRAYQSSPYDDYGCCFILSAHNATSACGDPTLGELLQHLREFEYILKSVVQRRRRHAHDIGLAKITDYSGFAQLLHEFLCITAYLQR